MSWHDLPPYMLYPVLIPHVLKLCIKHRMSLAGITKANPLFKYGGLPFAPKDQMCKHFDRVLPYELVKCSDALTSRIAKAKVFAKKYNYPIIVKPNTGHRGIDVHLAKDDKNLHEILQNQKWDYIIQEYCDYPEEFGLFYYREPGNEHGEIISVTRKVIPILEGDNKSTIGELINNSNQIENKRVLLARHKERLLDVLKTGEKFRLLVQAAHSRGCIFSDGQKYLTQELLRAVDTICNIRGFHFGRLDVKAKSLHAIQNGEFKIIEVNGATSEFIHVYDNSYTYRQGINDLKRQWSLLFKIAAMNKHNTQSSISIRQFIKQYLTFFAQTKRVIGKLW